MPKWENMTVDLADTLLAFRDDDDGLSENDGESATSLSFAFLPPEYERKADLVLGTFINGSVVAIPFFCCVMQSLSLIIELILPAFQRLATKKGCFFF
jgi:hypothetical protein